MKKSYVIDEIKSISLSMFRKNFFGVFHGSISARLDYNKFVINKKDAIFDGLKDEDLISLYPKKDYRWNEASIDSDIHLNIYKNISEAKYICYTMPPFVTAYSLANEKIIPQDYFGFTNLGEIEIFDIKNFEDWYERADTEIYRYMLEKQTNVMVIKGYGVYVYARSAHNMAKTVALLENSCKLLKLSTTF